MLRIGKFNNLRVVKTVDFGVYLDGGEYGEILMPRKYVPEGLADGGEVEAFVYFDSEDRIIATTERPLIEVGEFGMLTAVSSTRFGTFMDWGLLKDLLVPFREQQTPIKVGDKCVVYAYFDHESKRIVGSTKLNKYVGNKIPKYNVNDTVDLLAVQKTDLGFKVIVDNLFWGLIYNNDLFDPIYPGDRLQGYVKNIRDDGKVDVTIRGSGDRVFSLVDRISGYLSDNGGKMPLTDSSSPEDIKEVFQCSKKDFKKALGFLYKRGRIDINDDSVCLRRRPGLQGDN